MSHPHLRDNAPEDNSANGTVIEYYAKNVYGNWLFYIVNGIGEAAVKQLTGKVTISEGDIAALRDLVGVSNVIEVAPPRGSVPVRDLVAREGN